MEIVRVVQAAPLDVQAPARQNLEYILFGAPSNAFLAHRVGRAPSFDQVLSVTLPNPPPESELAKGISVFVENTPDDVQSRLGPGPVSLQFRNSRQSISGSVIRELSALVGPEFTEPPARSSR